VLRSGPDAEAAPPAPERYTVISLARFHLPEELTVLSQWIIWRYEERGGAKPTKVPCQCTGYQASVTNPGHWSSYEYALRTWREQRVPCAGIGFVFTPEDPYCGVDLDNCYPSDAAECAPWAAGILHRFSDTYSEESPSARGVKIWCRARAPRCGRWTIEYGVIEIYDHARFFVVTGRFAGISAITDHQTDIEKLVAKLDEGRPQGQARIIPDAIPQGQRHPALVSLAGTMWRRGMDAEAVEAALLVVNERQCDPPHTPEHIHKIVVSMQRWER
jgi:hypothetical protein